MATANQEKTYNDFVKFYDLADDLITKAELCQESYALKQFDEVEKMVYFIEDATDVLTNDYIEIVKNSKDAEKVKEIKSILIKIQEKTKDCKDKLQSMSEKK